MKRAFSSALAAVLLVCCFSIPAYAINITEPRASLTISDYSVTLKAGSWAGELRINYDITATTTADSIGVSSIVIYKSDGTRVTTITGTTSNGFVEKSTGSVMGEYLYAAKTGTSYYAKVTLFSTCSGTTDSRTVTTSTVKAP